MSEPYVAEMMMFGGTFAIRGWSTCDGQLLPISSNSALFSIVGTLYGGDGRTTMGLPDLRGRMPMHWGSGPGLSSRRQGLRSGYETTTLTTSNMPSHTHTMYAENGLANLTNPANAMLATHDASNAYRAYSSASGEKTMATQSIGHSGGSQAVGIMNPFLTVTFLIALQGVYPSRS